MHAKRAPPALREYRKIAACLRCLDDSEGIFLVGDRKINGVVTGDLEEDTTVGAALVGLSRRVQKARPKSENGRYLLLVPHAVANGLQSSFILGVHGDVAEQSEIIPCACPTEMSFQDLDQRLSLLQGLSVFRVRIELHTVAFEEGLFGRQLARRFVFAREFAGYDLAGFDVWLVEGVDADDRACHGCGNLPAEKFFADRVWILHGDTHDWLACFLQRFHRGVLSAI